MQFQIPPKPKSLSGMTDEQWAMRRVNKLENDLGIHLIEIKNNIAYFTNKQIKSIYFMWFKGDEHSNKYSSLTECKSNAKINGAEIIYEYDANDDMKNYWKLT